MMTRMQQSADWMRVEEVSGFDDFSMIYDDVVVGKMNPNEGIVVLTS